MSTPASQVDELLRHGQWLYRLARDMVRDDDLARDLVQETWLVAMRSAHPRDEKVRPWLRGVVRNLARMSVRSAIRRRGREHACVDQDGVIASPDEALERFEAERLLSTEVRRLAEPYRTTLLLLYVDGLSAADVARRLQISDGTVRWRHQHALTQLRRVLTEGDPQRRRLRALLLPIGAAAVQGSIELLRGKSLWAVLLALGLALSSWSGDGPSARALVTFAAARSAAATLAPPVRVAPARAPAAAPADPGELLVVVTDRTDVPIAGASASIDGFTVGHTAPDGHLVVVAEAGLALPEDGTIAVDAAGYQPAAAGFRLGEPVHVRLAELEPEPAAATDDRPEQPLEARPARAAPTRAEAMFASRPPARPAADVPRPPRRVRCSPADSRAGPLNQIRKELLMMGRYGSPYALVAAVVAALHQIGCAADAGGVAAEQQLEADGDHGDGDDHPGDGGDDEGDDGDDHPGDDEGDGGGGDDGDGGDTCPVDPCEGTSEVGVHVVSECSSMLPIETSILLTCAGSRERCQERALAEPDRSIYCEWGGDAPEWVEVFRHEANPEVEECDVFGPPPCEPTPPSCNIPCDGGPGSYSGFYCGADGEPFIHTEGGDCGTALGNCALNAALHPDKDIVCEFNGEEIFRREVNEGSCVAEHGEPTVNCELPLPALCEGDHPCVSEGTSRYEGSFCDGGTFIRTRNIECQAALGNCILNASLDLTRSIRCQWNEQEIYRHEVEAGVCEEYGPTCELPAP